MDRLRRRDYGEAYEYLQGLWQRFPERISRHVPALRRSNKARLASLIEAEDYDGAMDHLRMSEQFPFEVLEPDMATYAIYYKLVRDQSEEPSEIRQGLIKFLLNHNAFGEASYVG